MQQATTKQFLVPDRFRYKLRWTLTNALLWIAIVFCIISSKAADPSIAENRSQGDFAETNLRRDQKTSSVDSSDKNADSSDVRRMQQLYFDEFYEGSGRHRKKDKKRSDALVLHDVFREVSPIILPEPEREVFVPTEDPRPISVRVVNYNNDVSRNTNVNRGDGSAGCCEALIGPISALIQANIEIPIALQAILTQILSCQMNPSQELQEILLAILAQLLQSQTTPVPTMFPPFTTPVPSTPIPTLLPTLVPTPPIITTTTLPAGGFLNPNFTITTTPAPGTILPEDLLPGSIFLEQLINQENPIYLLSNTPLFWGGYNYNGIFPATMSPFSFQSLEDVVSNMYSGSTDGSVTFPLSR